MAARHPEWWVALIAGVAWVGLTWFALWGKAPGGHAHIDNFGSGSVEAVVTMALMPLAMMSPLVMGAVRHTAATTFWHRRQRAARLYLAGFLAVWLGVGALLTLAIAMAASLGGWQLVTAGAFAAAVLWQFTQGKRRALRRCDRRLAVPGEGWTADRACLSHGVASGFACAGACWALMAAVIAVHHHLLVMLALFAVQIHERRAWRFRPQATAGWVAAVGLATLSVSRLP